MYLAVPVGASGADVAVVRTSQPRARLTAECGGGKWKSSRRGLLAVALDQARSLFAARRISGHRQIRRGAEHLARGHWKYRLPDNPTEEIGMLADSLNAMASQLDKRIQRILRQQSEHQAVLSSMEEGVMAVDRGGTVLSVNDPAPTCWALTPKGFAAAASTKSSASPTS